MVDEERLAWEQRRKELREEEWSVGGNLMRKAKDMLIFPVAEVRKEEDGRVTILEPAKWTFSDAARVAETASKLERLAAGMATERRDEFKWSADDCTDEELERIANGEEPRVVLGGRRQGGSGVGTPEAGGAA